MTLQEEGDTGDFVARKTLVPGVDPVEIRVHRSDTSNLVMRVVSLGEGMEVVAAHNGNNKKEAAASGEEFLGTCLHACPPVCASCVDTVV